MMNPMALLAVVALSLVAALCLFLSVKKEIALLRRDVAARADQWTQDKEHIETRLQRLELEETSPPPPLQALASAIAGSASSVTLTRRSQALRRWRRGESADQIATALEMPRVEVELLIKAYRAASAETLSSAAAGH
jgi:hypothetical protein